MIKEDELLDAIAECQGTRKPNAETCIKLASYYVIHDHMYKDQKEERAVYSNQYSFDPPEIERSYSSETEFGQIIGQVDWTDAMKILDELVTTLKVMQPRLFEAVIRRLTALK